MTLGGYESGYEHCPCFWGTVPGSLVRALSAHVVSFAGLRVLDAGCGEGKNAFYLASQGACVRAIDVSPQALLNGKAAFGMLPQLRWELGDVRSLSFESDLFDLVITYGLFHCFESRDEILRTIQVLKHSTAGLGLHVVCAFNQRDQDLRAHPDFVPTLLGHEEYLKAYADWEIVHSSDLDLIETHPHNFIEHHHSMTRIIARKTS